MVLMHHMVPQEESPEPPKKNVPGANNDPDDPNNKSLGGTEYSSSESGGEKSSPTHTVPVGQVTSYVPVQNQTVGMRYATPPRQRTAVSAYVYSSPAEIAYAMEQPLGVFSPQSPIPVEHTLRTVGGNQAPTPGEEYRHKQPFFQPHTQEVQDEPRQWNESYPGEYKEFEEESRRQWETMDDEWNRHDVSDTHTHIQDQRRPPPYKQPFEQKDIRGYVEVVPATTKKHAKFLISICTCF